MKVSLKNRNSTGELIGFIKKGAYSYYCMADVEYFVGDSWYGYIYFNNDQLEDDYFVFLQQFKVDYFNLKKEYCELIKSNDQFEIYGNLPTIYIDFDAKIFISNFHEQALENRVVPRWTGKYSEVIELIPMCFRYWLCDKPLL